MSNIIDTMQNLEAKQQQAWQLREQLKQTMIVDQIAPGLLDNGPVQLKGLKAMMPYPSRLMGFTRAWLQSPDGKQYRLSASELAILKPDHYIHPNYE